MASYDPKTLYTFLAELGILSKADLDKAYTETVQKNKPFDEVLLELELVSDENIGKAVADVIKTPFVTLSKIAIPDDVLRLIPEVVARKELVIAFGKDEKGLRVAMYNPENQAVIQQVAKTTGWPVVVSYATKKDIEDAAGKYATNAV